MLSKKKLFIVFLIILSLFILNLSLKAENLKTSNRESLLFNKELQRAYNKRRSVILDFFQLDPHLLSSSKIKITTHDFNPELLLKINLDIYSQKFIKDNLNLLEFPAANINVMSQAIFEYLFPSENSNEVKTHRINSESIKIHLRNLKFIQNKFGDKTLARTIKNAGYYKGYKKSFYMLTGTKITLTTLDLTKKNNSDKKENHIFFDEKYIVLDDLIYLKDEDLSDTINSKIIISVHKGKSVLYILNTVSKSIKLKKVFEQLLIDSINLMNNDIIVIHGFSGTKKVTFKYHIKNNQIRSLKFN